MKRYSNSDQIDERIRRLLAFGWTYRRGTKHGRVVSPDGRAAVMVAGTPRDRRSSLNFVRGLKRPAISKIRP